jgi:hypothetical protein
MRTSQKLDSLVWTGRQFLYVQNTTNTMWVAPPAGHPLRRFATMPRLSEETRCILSPGVHGFPVGVIFCHSPNNNIYEISANGSKVSVFAKLPAPYPPPADGALTFDDLGHFGYRLVAATGRSGKGEPPGGLVFTIDSSGRIRRIGAYAGPGGADEVAIAPPHFGAVGGDALLTVDAGPRGSVLAVDPSGRTTVLATLPDGPNGLVPIPKVTAGTATPTPGVYLSDDTTGYTYMAPAAQLAPFAGNVLVASEIHGWFWILEPKGAAFTAIRMRDNLPNATYSLEQAVFVG